MMIIRLRSPKKKKLARETLGYVSRRA